VPSWTTVAIAFVVALALSIYLAPILIRAALRYGIVDKPKPPLKVHKDPVPYLGGLVVFLAFLLALALVFPFDQRVLAILLSSSLVVSVGLVDDLGTLTPKDKFIGQIIASLVLVKAGVAIQIDVVPSPVDEILSVLWLLTCMNAFNILDVSDGLATTAGFTGAVGAVAIALINGETLIAAMAAALAGACLGFLRVNRQPARMYLGDTGAMFLGAILGSLAMTGRYSDQNAVSAWLAPLAIVSAPLFDLGLVILARLKARRRIWYGSPDHYAIRLKAKGWSARNVARATMAFGAALMLAAISSTFLVDKHALIVAAGCVLFVIVMLVVVFARFPAPKPKEEA
jgi:UDP-GlcNAc:undecaprenyl-phosphate/decaprenyl-phosphate GlcNAc-1-phosphate transferase